MSTNTLANLTLPSSDALMQNGDENQVAEVRNHIVVSRYLTEVGLASPGTPGVSLADIKRLSQVILAWTSAKKLYKYGWGRRVQLGDFRSAPISVRSNPIAIFPYAEEVQACMERFTAWCDDCHSSSRLHPLILTTQIFVYLTCIHPFPDGNGRVGRALMADSMVRQGYLPVVFVDLDKQDYLRMVAAATDGHPEELCQPWR